MSVVKKTGKIAEFNRAIEFEFQIHDFLSYEEEKIFSPDFQILNSIWRIEIWPKFVSSDCSTTYVSLYLCKVSNQTPKNATLISGIKNASNTLVYEKSKTFTFSGQGLGWSHFIERRILLSEKEDMVPFGTLTIIFAIVINSKEQEFVGRPDKLVEDLKGMFDKKMNSDVILQVNKHKISAHKSILSARSPVFAAMFNNEMAEMKTGIVNITDCDLKTFNVFLLYIYSGEVEFDKCDAFLLYRIADKYDVPELMMICVDFLISNICTKNICDMLIFGKQFNENTLLDYTQRFFNHNFIEIVKSDSWKSLFKEHFNIAKELLKGTAPKFKVMED